MKYKLPAHKVQYQTELSWQLTKLIKTLVHVLDIFSFSWSSQVVHLYKESIVSESILMSPKSIKKVRRNYLWLNAMHEHSIVAVSSYSFFGSGHLLTKELYLNWCTANLTAFILKKGSNESQQYELSVTILGKEILHTTSSCCASWPQQ